MGGSILPPVFMKFHLDNVFKTDLRSLGLMRVGIAICLIADLCIRFTDLKAHYTDQGILPLELLFRTGWLPEYFSIHNIGNSPGWVEFIFYLNFIPAICLLTGYKTRISSITCWVFLVSLHNRNNLIHQGGDDLLRLILFWGMFLPWGRYFSVDKMVTTKPTAAPAYASGAGAGYILLIFSMYFFSALLKNGQEWNKDYTAIYYALSLDMIVLPLGKLIYPYPLLLKFLTAFVYFIELVCPFLLFIPVKNSWFRVIFIGTIWAFQLGISLTLFVGIFPFIASASLIGLIPSSIWKKLPDTEVLENVTEPLWRTTALLLVVVYSLYLNAYHFISYQVDWFEKARPVSNLIRIDQRWGMFAPIVFRDDGWFVFQGTTSTDSIDIHNQGRKVDFTKPALVVSQVKNDRWRKYQENILFVHNQQLRPYYCNWLLREWNDTSSVKIQFLQIIYMKEVSMADYETLPLSKEVLCSCAR